MLEPSLGFYDASMISDPMDGARMNDAHPSNGTIVVTIQQVLGCVIVRLPLDLFNFVPLLDQQLL